MSEQFKIIAELPDGEECVAMVTFEDRIYLATQHRIFVLVNDELHPLEFVVREKL